MRGAAERGAVDGDDFSKNTGVCPLLFESTRYFNPNIAPDAVDYSARFRKFARVAVARAC